MTPQQAAEAMREACIAALQQNFKGCGREFQVASEWTLTRILKAIRAIKIEEVIGNDQLSLK